MDPTDSEIDDSPLEMEYRPVQLPPVPPEMLFYLALGREDELVVASRYGFSVEDYHRLCQLRPFKVALAAQRAQLDKDGITFQVMAAMQAAELRDKTWIQAMGEEVSLSQRLEALKTFAKLGNLEPKEVKSSVGAGTGFSIQINLGDKSISMSNTPQSIQAVQDVNLLEAE
jgi:hypothetical protein